jgi:hypothetical protein
MLNESSISYEGYLHLLFSLFLPEVQFRANEVTDLIQQEFLCGIDSVLLFKDSNTRSDCQGKDNDENTRSLLESFNSVSSNATILLNFPTTHTVVNTFLSSNFNLTYTRWNVSYPVFQWGGDSVQQTLQNLLNSHIFNNEINLPWELGELSIFGDEEAGFLGKESIAENDPEDVKVMRILGGSLCLIHTIILVLLYKYALSYLKGKAHRRKISRSHLMEATRVNDMLYVSARLIKEQKEIRKDKVTTASLSSGSY